MLMLWCLLTKRHKWIHTNHYEIREHRGISRKYLLKVPNKKRTCKFCGEREYYRVDNNGDVIYIK
jgi:hypothetical protein